MTELQLLDLRLECAYLRVYLCGVACAELERGEVVLDVECKSVLLGYLLSAICDTADYFIVIYTGERLSSHRGDKGAYIDLALVGECSAYLLDGYLEAALLVEQLVALFEKRAHSLVELVEKLGEPACRLLVRPFEDGVGELLFRALIAALCIFDCNECGVSGGYHSISLGSRLGYNGDLPAQVAQGLRVKPVGELCQAL